MEEPMDCAACESDDVWTERLGGSVFVRCAKCGKEGEYYDHLDDAIKAWNEGDGQR